MGGLGGVGGGDECVQMGKKRIQPRPVKLHVSLSGEAVIDDGTEAVCVTTHQPV